MMIPDRSKVERDLRCFAAKFVLGIYQSWDLPPLADELLDRGLYSPSLHELAMAKHAIMSDAGPLLIKALGELGVSVPSRDEAAWAMARMNIEQMCKDGEHSPEVAVYELWKTVGQNRDVAAIEGDHGAGLDVREFFDVCRSYEELDWDAEEQNESSKMDLAARRLAVDARARALAAAWLARHPSQGM
ncbi:MAG: hypothetical protein WC718_07505 [Phycisphaerales bacterium]|jgi:hypothetical protein